VNEKGFAPSDLKFTSSPDGLLLVQLMGDWKIGNPLPSPAEVGKKLTAGTQIKRVGFDTSKLKAWDSGLLTFLIKVKESCSQNKIPFEAEGLPEGAKGLLNLASAVAERKGARKEFKRESFFSMVGASAVEFYEVGMGERWFSARNQPSRRRSPERIITRSFRLRAEPWAFSAARSLRPSRNCPNKEKR